MRAGKHQLWQKYFVQYSYYRSETAQDPVWKLFKRFPVEPDLKYIKGLHQAFLDGDFNQRDILIEVLNIQYEVQDLREEGLISGSAEHFIDKEIKELCERVGIYL
jgi:hypothetical protein